MAEKLNQDQRSEIMRKVRGKDTKPELVVRRLLHRLGYRFRLHVRELSGRPDVVLPKYRTVVFVHGCFWHGHTCPKGRLRPVTNAEFWARKIDGNIKRDAKHRVDLQDSGWQVLTVWECELKNAELLDEYFSRIKANRA